MNVSKIACVQSPKVPFFQPKKNLIFFLENNNNSWYTSILYIVYTSYIFFYSIHSLKSNVHFLDLDLEIDS